MRSLSADEHALWERVTATIRPLSREKVNCSPERPAEPRGAAERAASKPPAPKRRQAAPLARPPQGLSKGTLDSSWDRRLRAGSVEPDRVLDLHGFSLDRAWRAVDQALEQSIAAGDRVLLLITGHARPGDPPVQRGKIRVAVHDWLAASRHSTHIAAVRNAHRRHGGGGSIYIILRRNRGGSTFS